MAPTGPGLFLLPSDAPGLAIGPRLQTLAFRGAPVADLTLEGCLVPAAQVLAPERGPEALAALRAWEDQALTAASLGIMQRSLVAARARAKEHQSGGRPIIAYQEIGFKLAEMLTLTQTAQLLAQRAAWLVGAGDREALLTAVCAKVFCAEAAETVASQAMQVLGGRGLLAGNPVEEAYRDAKQLQIWGTSSELARVKIGDMVLQSY
jgi:alkylation response protein AidB-like acyl-CoA dehydrogenase